MIALLVMIVRAVVPSGFMLATAEAPSARYLTVTVCSGEAHGLTSVDLATGKVVDPKQEPTSPRNQSPQQTCVFAVSAAMAPPGDIAQLRAELSSDPEADRPLRDVRPIVRVPVRTPPSTGPPTSA